MISRHYADAGDVFEGMLSWLLKARSCRRLRRGDKDVVDDFGFDHDW